MTLEGKLAFVTGASAGIGRATAVALAAAGARVMVGYHTNKEGAEETLKGCPEGAAVLIDVRSEESVAAAFEEIELNAGTVNVLINNAGATADTAVLRMSDSDWTSVLDVNLTGVFRCTRRGLPAMVRGGYGRIVSIGSVVGSAGNPGQANYSAAKAGVVGFTKSVARELAKTGVTANVVAPGLIDTQLTSHLPGKARDSLLERIPMRRAGDPDEVAEIVVACVESSYLTGQVINVDGGLS